MASQINHLELPSPTPHQQPITPTGSPLRRSPPPQHQASAIDECIAGHQRELEALLAENQRLSASHAALKQEYTSIKQDLRHLAAISQKIKAEKDAELRGVLERSVKVEAEFRAIETFSADLAVVRQEVQKRKLEKEELGARLKAVNGDIAKAKLEVRDLPEIRAEKERIAQDNKKGRAAVEVERKNRTINLEQGQEMEKIKLSMIKEIDKLNAELANAKKRARAAAATTVANVNQGLGYRTKYSSSSRVNRIGSSPVQYQIVKDQDGSNHSSSNRHDPVQPVVGRGKQEPEMSVTDSKSHQNNENVQQEAEAGNENPQPTPIPLDAASMKFLRDMMAETFQPYVQKQAGQPMMGGPTPPPPLAGNIVLTKEDENKVFREWMRYESKSIRARHEKMDELATLEESKKPNNAKRKACQRYQQGEYNQGIRAISNPRAPAQSGEAQASSYHCYNCGDPSHLRKDCDKPDRICRNCGKNGHIAVFCKTKGKKNKNVPKLASTKGSVKQSESSNVLFQSRAKV